MERDEQLEALLNRYQDYALFDGCKVEHANSLAIDGESILHKAVMMKDVAGVELLLRNSADPNQVGDMGYTPLHQAAFYNTLQIAEILIHFGAVVDAKNDLGETPSDLAKEHKPQILYKFLKNR